MRTIISAMLQFGAIYVPVGVATSAKRKEIEFRTLHADCGHPINKVDICKTCQSDMSLPLEDLVKGYEIAKDTFVQITPDELDLLVPAKSRSIELVKFIDASEVHPLMIERSYFLTPNKVVHQPYELLALALEQADKLGIGRARLWGKEFPVVVNVDQGVLILHYLFHADELVSGGEVQATLAYEVGTEELELVKTFIDKRAGSLEPADLRNDTREVLLSFIEAKATGKEQAMPEPPPEPKPTVNMLDTLREMIAAGG